MTDLRTAISGDVGTPSLYFMAAAALILLLTCTNLTHLLLVREARRRGEVAVRLALGASRWRLV